MNKSRQFFCFSTIHLVAIIAILAPRSVVGQDFVRVQDNAIATATGPGQYSGVSWVDIDNDGDLDLYVNNSTVFRNDGDDSFEAVATNIGSGFSVQTGNGNTWADYDNDGDLDVVVCNNQTVLFRNDGDFNFSAQQSGALSTATAARGWSCAFADYDNDGYVDLAVTHPAGFVPPTSNPTSNHLLRNGGPPGYTYSAVSGTPITSGLAAYTVGTWSDFDLDGDQDYHVGAGPANGTFARDFLYRNLLTESGTATFERISESPIGTNLQDGQVWNWIDYDNDGDLDGFLTNWGGASGGRHNRLYRNDLGVYTNQVQSPAVIHNDVSLGQVWADFDNDGDLDLYVGNDSNQPGRYYENDSDSLIARTSVAPAENATRRGLAAGDYDGDGDIDLLTAGPGTGNLRLYRNDLDDSNAYLKIHLRGDVSNRSAIGAKVRATALINGTPVTQLRELQSQTSFNSQNAMEIHFGFADADTVARLEISWPSGTEDVLTNVPVNQSLSITEGAHPVAIEEHATPGDVLDIEAIYPHPVGSEGRISITLGQSGIVSAVLYDLIGRERRLVFDGRLTTGRHEFLLDASSLPPGAYLLLVKNGVQSAGRIVTVVRD